LDSGTRVLSFGFWVSVSQFRFLGIQTSSILRLRVLLGLWQAVNTMLPPCRCPTCQEPRFVSYETQKGTCFKPRKTFIEFGVEKALRELWADLEFCKAWNGGEERDVDGPDFWGGKYADEINERVGGVVLFEAEGGGYELGFDYGQPYKRQKYSLGVVCIRSLDLPGERRSEKRFRKTVAIFPGPNEPKWLWLYFQGIFTDFLVGWKKGEFYNGRCLQTVLHFELSNYQTSRVGRKFSRISFISGSSFAVDWALLQSLSSPDPFPSSLHNFLTATSSFGDLL
jgi:hypothetical protein